MAGELGAGDDDAHREREREADQRLAQRDHRHAGAADVVGQRHRRRQRQGDEHTTPTRTSGGANVPPKTGAASDEHAGPHQQEAEPRDRRRSRSAHQLRQAQDRAASRSRTPARSIQGNVSAKATKIAAARGMNASTLS